MTKITFSILITSMLLLLGCTKTPKDVTLNALEQDASGVQISWSESDDRKFESYKVYRHSSSGIDETTGELIHVSTSSAENSFTDEDIDPLETYYYRVFVQNKKKLSSGSNIENITTQTISLVENGSFETGIVDPANWTLVKNHLGDPLNEIEIDPSKAADGGQSLKFHHNAPTGCWEMWIEQTISLSELTAVGSYEFELSYLSETFLETGGMGFKLYNSDFDVQISLNDLPGDGIWRTQVGEFTLPADIGSADPLLRFHFCIPEVNDRWIDNIKITKV